VRRTALIAVPAVALAAGAATLAPPALGAAGAAGAAPAGVSFGVPRIVDPIHVYGEPDIVVNPKTGAVHASGPQGTGTQRSIYNISVDGGDSYRIVQNLPENTDRAAQTSAGVPTKSALGPGGGDTEIQIAHNGRAFFNDLAALTSFTAVTTTDDGKTTSVANPLAIPKPLGDRQWMALYDPQKSDQTVSPYKGPVPLNYMEYDNLVVGDSVALSDDGVDYSRSAGEYADDGKHQVNNGVPVLDQHTGKFLGLTTATSGRHDLALFVGVPTKDGTLAPTAPAGTTDPKFSHYHDIALGLKGSPETLFPVLAQDGARNLYAVWIDDSTYQVYYSWTRPGADNEWNHWTKPRAINRPPGNVNVFPWVAAGKAPGVIDVAWYGTDKTLGQLGKEGPSAKKGQTWQLFFAQVTNAASTSPRIDQVVAAPHPMHFNDICLLGSACIAGAGNRNQADFFKVAVDPLTGRARIIYTDSSNGLSQAGSSDSPADHQGAALDTVVTQRTGVSANDGKPLKANESTAPVSGVTDPAGDALFKPLGGTNVPGADLTSVSVRRSGSDLVATVKTAAPLGDAAAAAGTLTAQAVVRWQLGNTLYFVAAEADAAGGPPRYYGGKTDSVDLCSVSGCKPNYLTYNAAPNAGVVAGVGTVKDNRYEIRVPLSALGSPKDSSLLEEVMGFVVASPTTGVVPQNNGADFADIAPLQLEGTKTFNTTFATSSKKAAGGGASTSPTTGSSGGSQGASGSGSGSGSGSRAGSGAGAGTSASVGRSLASTGLATLVPVVALVLVGTGLLVARRRRHQA